jgi:hypothetical protein
VWKLLLGKEGRASETWEARARHHASQLRAALRGRAQGDGPPPGLLLPPLPVQTHGRVVVAAQRMQRGAIDHH